MKSRLKKIKLLILDVDGVLTDGRIIYNSEGHEIKNFDVKDGFGIVMFQRLGFKTAIISARASKAVAIRAKDLRINKIFQNAFPKTAAYYRLLRLFDLKDNQVCFIGDDLPDLPILKRAGFAVTVPNAVSEVKKIAHYTTRKPGGKGAVREVIELILKAQGKWQAVLKGVE